MFKFITEQTNTKDLFKHIPYQIQECTVQRWHMIDAYKVNNNKYHYYHSQVGSSQSRPLWCLWVIFT